MKVLEHGNPNGWGIEKRCTGEGNGGGGCNAKLLVSKDDIFITTCNIRDETDYYYTFKCPECGTLTDIPNKEIPVSVALAAKEKYHKEHLD